MPVRRARKVAVGGRKKRVSQSMAGKGFMDFIKSVGRTVANVGKRVGEKALDMAVSKGAIGKAVGLVNPAAGLALQTVGVGRRRRRRAGRGQAGGARLVPLAENRKVILM